jgi:hypothetical protein
MNELEIDSFLRVFRRILWIPDLLKIKAEKAFHGEGF